MGHPVPSFSAFVTRESSAKFDFYVALCDECFASLCLRRFFVENRSCGIWRLCCACSVVFVFFLLCVFVLWPMLGDTSGLAGATASASHGFFVFLLVLWVRSICTCVLSICTCVIWVLCVFCFRFCCCCCVFLGTVVFFLLYSSVGFFVFVNTVTILTSSIVVAGVLTLTTYI